MQTQHNKLITEVIHDKATKTVQLYHLDQQDDSLIVDPNDILTEHFDSKQMMTRQQPHVLGGRHRGLGGQTRMSPRGPPLPLELNTDEDEVPQCDSSGQIQISMGDEDTSKKKTIQQSNNKTLQKMAHKSAQNSNKIKTTKTLNDIQKQIG